MTKIAILPLKEMPKSCSECVIKCYLSSKNSDRCDNTHPQCPLISIDIDLLEVAVETVQYEIKALTSLDLYASKHYQKIKSTIDKLGGKQ